MASVTTKCQLFSTDETFNARSSRCKFLVTIHQTDMIYVQIDRSDWPICVHFENKKLKFKNISVVCLTAQYTNYFAILSHLKWYLFLTNIGLFMTHGLCWFHVFWECFSIGLKLRVWKLCLTKAQAVQWNLVKRLNSFPQEKVDPLHMKLFFSDWNIPLESKPEIRRNLVGTE